MTATSENQLVRIVRLGLWFIGLVLLLYLISFIINTAAPMNFRGDTFFKTIEAQLLELAGTIWLFLKPFLQIVLCIIVLDFALKRLGIKPNLKLNLKEMDFKMKFPSLLLLIVVVAFALTIFYEIERAEGLKELALVIIGYYFGTQTDVLKLKKNEEIIKVPEKV